MPRAPVVEVRASAMTLAMPKSRSLTRGAAPPSASSRKTFSGLRSRWTSAVRGLERAPELLEDAARLGDRERAALLDARREGLAVEQLHREVGQARRRVDAGDENLDDVRRPDEPRRPRLPLEAAALLGVGGAHRVHDLHGALARGAVLAAQIHAAHAARAEGAHDLEIAADEGASVQAVG
ncbi:hypothetical protein BE20_32410 [Sorangium cellulosum]|nr:hypothetical protein BE20_32410 [Sorangium cellulosum]